MTAREIRIGPGVQSLVALFVALVVGILGTLTWLDSRYTRTWELQEVRSDVAALSELKAVVQQLVVRVEVLLDRGGRTTPPGGPAQAAPPKPAPDDAEQLTREIEDLIRRLDREQRKAAPEVPAERPAP